MRNNFAVKSQSFETYERFKKEAEDIGYKYNSYFCEFNENRLAYNNCLYFSKSWAKSNDFNFSLSNVSDGSDVFNIDHEDGYSKAISCAKRIIKKATTNVTSRTKKQLILLAEWLEYNGKHQTPKQQVKSFIEDQRSTKLYKHNDRRDL